MLEIHPQFRRVLFIAGAAVLLATAEPSGAEAYTPKTLHSFCSWANCDDGFSPFAGVLIDQSGTAYSTAAYGGKTGGGVVLKLIYNPSTGKWKGFVIHHFCAKTNCRDGNKPEGDLISDVDGNLYGTTYGGGKNAGDGVGGVIFKLAHVANGWKLTVLHDFCSASHCSDGNLPMTGLSYAGQASGAPWDEFSPLYGTTSVGGTYHNGVAYELTSDGSLWNYTVIHNFQSSSTPNALLVDSSGNIFGATRTGGKYGGGLLYKLAAGTWKETALHYFCSMANCTDGSQSRGRLVLDASGNLFGVTGTGGSNCVSDGGCGVVYERTASGTFTVLYNFCSLANCMDGSFPEALLMDSTGNLFGASYFGGAGGLDENGNTTGTVFELVNAGGSWTQSVLYSFCSQQGCTDGAHAISLFWNKSGDLFGTTGAGGLYNCFGTCGTVFELTP